MRSIVLVCVVAALVATGSAGAAAGQTRCTPTANDGGGPDRVGAIRLRAKIGTGHVLTGVVLSPSCKPVAGARVSFWQANKNGVYTAAGRGAVVTDKAGHFRFEGPMPTSYSGRPAHIHIKVEAADFVPLFTEYFPGGTRRGAVRLVLTPNPL